MFKSHTLGFGVPCICGFWGVVLWVLLRYTKFATISVANLGKKVNWALIDTHVITRNQNSKSFFLQKDHGEFQVLQEVKHRLWQIAVPGMRCQR